MSTQPHRKAVTFSVSAQPEEFKKIEDSRGDIPRSKYIINKVVNGNNVNTDVINSELREVTSRIMLLEDILKKMVPAMIQNKVSVTFSDKEFEEVSKFA